MSFSFFQTATRTTPEVRIDGEEGIVEFKGSSSPEHVERFFQPIFEAVDDLQEVPSEKITATFDMVYFNSGTSKCLFVVLKKLKGLEDNGKDVHVNWHYEEDDEGMLEVGEDFQDILRLPFEFKEVEVEEEE